MSEYVSGVRSDVLRPKPDCLNAPEGKAIWPRSEGFDLIALACRIRDAPEAAIRIARREPSGRAVDRVIGPPPGPRRGQDRAEDFLLRDAHDVALLMDGSGPDETAGYIDMGAFDEAAALQGKLRGHRLPLCLVRRGLVGGHGHGTAFYHLRAEL